MRSLAIVVLLSTPFLLGTAQIAPTPGCSLEASAGPVVAELPKLKKAQDRPPFLQTHHHGLRRVHPSINALRTDLAESEAQCASPCKRAIS